MPCRVPTLPFSTTIPPSMQGLWMPMPESSASEYSLTPTLNISPTATDTSSDSLGEERTVQMTFIDHMLDPDSLKTATPAVVLALTYAYHLLPLQPLGWLFFIVCHIGVSHTGAPLTEPLIKWAEDSCSRPHLCTSSRGLKR
jgi:hypothetical protein